ncbi:uncharacterized protein BDW70DRAFT_160387 [Aspergillus foveolatus]|uniref:uncharacterized protein n=1 Tax=Aspergillus foveolatus TaxID=210207 RepID=UPI003CCCF08C
MYDWRGGHSGPPAKSDGCTELGDRSSFCCDPPLSGGSPFFPVPLENLFPDANSIPADYSPTFAMVFDEHADELASGVTGEHPNDEPFAWVVMVGKKKICRASTNGMAPTSSFLTTPVPQKKTSRRKRSVQSASTLTATPAIALISERGVSKAQLSACPQGHLRKRYPSGAVVYDFHYDYDFKNLRRDGGGINFRADLSTHPAYWDTIVASPVKRSGETWRDLDRRWLSELDPSAKLAHFKKVFGETAAEAEAEKMGLKKHYEFHRCLFEASATCAGNPAYNVSAEARMYGELDTTMDLGIALIGTLRTFDFSEAYAAFAQHDLSVRVGAALRARALLHFDTGWHPLGPFNSFGMNLNLKGIFTINPSFDLDVRLEAQAYVSAQATGLGDYSLQGSPGPIEGQGYIEARVGGGLVFHFWPNIKVDVQVYFATETLVNASIKLSTDASIRFDLALSTKCTNGLQADVEGHIGMDLSIEGALPGWKNGATNLFPHGPTSLFSGCIPFDMLLGRSLQERASLSPIPDADTATCAVSVSGDYRANPDSDRDTDPDCDLRDTTDRNHPVSCRDLSWAEEEEENAYSSHDNNESHPRIQRPGTTGAEEAELQQFFITYSCRWSDRTGAAKYTNPNARYFRSPKASDDSELTWCEYMKLWWDSKNPANTRVCLAYPGMTEHDDEYVLLEQRLNGQVKMNWYKRVASYHTSYIEDYFQARDWSNVARTIKMQTLGWKYYSEYESNPIILAKQARRVKEKLEELEGNGPTSIQRTINPPFGFAREYGFTADCRNRLEEVKEWLNEWAKKAYDMNRPRPPAGQHLAAAQSIQQNPNIVEIFEIAWNEVQMLKDWTSNGILTPMRWIQASADDGRKL